ncbi:MAG: segregation/condensation protein A [Pseudoxanthomonas sp.]|nr:segregation/condensation protein A [Pseudoxanthomonas sp.]
MTPAQSQTDQAPTAATLPQQREMPLAVVQGQPFLKMPEDLYIPPDALEVILEAFEGPLDLLLYLIRRQNLDILDIPVAEITRQYMDYIGLMHELKLELAAEYLVMAAILAEIKSRLLLPRPPVEATEEDDPRAELVRRLQEYERFRKAAQDLDALPRQERDFMPVRIDPGERTVVRLPPPVDLRELLLALKDVLKRAELLTRHEVQRDALSVRQRMTEVLQRLAGGAFVRFESLFNPGEGRRGVVVTFMALLELAKEQLLEIVQEQPLAAIWLRAAGEADADAATVPDPGIDTPPSDETQWTQSA